MLNEIRKFNKNPAIRILLVVAIAMAIFVPLLFIHDYENYDYSTGKEEVVRGIDGLRLRKVQIEKIKGNLSIEELNEALTLYKSFPTNEEAYKEVEENYPGLFHMLREAYAPFAGENDFVVSDIDNANNYYEKNIQKIESKMSAFGDDYFSEEEKSEALQRASQIEGPFQYEFVDQWAILIKALIFVNMVIIFSSILISNQLFSYEKEKNMDLLLTTVGNKNLSKIAYNKIAAMLFYLIMQFLVCNVIVAGIVFGATGISGWNSQLQIMPEFFTVINNWTFGEMYMFYMGISCVGICGVALIGALINASLQRTYVSLIVTGIVVIAPMFIKNMSFMPVSISKVLSIQPINSINLLAYLDSLFSFKFGTIVLLSSTMILAITIGYMILSCVFTPVLFKKRINK